MASGRKRKVGAREPNGRLRRKPSIDRGTPEFQSRRCYDAGSGDQNMTWNLVGILLANNQITEPQLAAALEYRRLYGLVYKRTDVHTSPLERLTKVVPAEIDDGYLARCRARLLKMDALVSAQGHDAKQAFEAIVLFDKRPRWMMPVFPMVSDVLEAEMFRQALRAVTDEKNESRAA